ncbi:MAG: hypothetical protein C0402_06475 [Thermodesulfovibrio sp.]|nr:hypothetical protein [Thermodesulfovibrio sp.]
MKEQTKTVAILQSCYIPWKGYFDLINMVDEFILYDDMQYTRRDWRNRNIIKTPTGPLWLTIPVEVKGKYFQKISETKVSANSWREKHWKAICHNYSKANFFKDYAALFEDLFLGSQEAYLSLINYRFITAINECLGIDTKITWSSDYTLIEGKTDRLIDICKQAGAGTYVSGPAARGYIDEELFEKEDIRLVWMDYSGYPEYQQLYPPFRHEVSIVDLLFNEGSNAVQYMKTISCLKKV